MLKFLIKNGFVKVSQRGSHLKMYNSTTNRTTFIPMHNGDLPKGTENAILKEAELKK
ncbi:MAG: type II toxin-antitoxin system HicA family toxin [Erysipelotrichaceae bacterium]|nr:type II toxin-antitoxin system HicA family toxin [Erysipelotrichaceae bacterium]